MCVQSTAARECPCSSYMRAHVQLLLLAPIVVGGAWRYGSTQAVLGMAALTTALLCMRLQHIG